MKMKKTVSNTFVVMYLFFTILVAGVILPFWLKETKYYILFFTLFLTAVCLSSIYFIFKARKSLFRESLIFYSFVVVIFTLTVLIATILTFQQFFAPTLIDSSKTLQYLVIGTLITCFLLFPILLIVGGIKSIVSKESITPGPHATLRFRVNGLPAVVSGLFYIGLGLFVLSGYAVFYSEFMCEGSTTTPLCFIADLLKIPILILRKIRELRGI
ncbi:MAG: hypothetical protein Q7S79_00240 [bacterium]|nr:hypothetical protein [bacterium]